MHLVVDANIVIAALVKDSTTRKLLLSEKFELAAPQFLFEELEKHVSEISKKAKVGKIELNKLILHMQKTSKITIYESGGFRGLMKEAQKISPDKNDSQYFALALHLNCQIWSNDKEMKNQDKVGIFNTKEILELY
ncbi:MAG: PIN domain-containing protein [archaeon]|nr:PIN domain-containing protein [archaeon]